MTLKRIFLILVSLILFPLSFIHTKDSHELQVYNDVVITNNFNKSDLILLTKLINSESHGESLLDKLLVASVVLNRVNSNEFPNTLYEVIYQPNQFSGINTGLFRYNSSNRWDRESYEVAKLVLKFGPVNEDILYFLNPAISTNRGWVETVMRRPLFFRERNHWFFK